MIVTILLGILGAIMGSFAGAQVWRLRARQLVEDDEAGEKISRKELKKLSPITKKKISKDRSYCLQCGQQLAWYDLLPIVSWVTLRGKCRYCRKFIGWTELALELALAAVFAASAMLWSNSLGSWVQVGLLVIWLTAAVLLAIMFVYDLKWQLLPDLINLPFIALAAVFAIIKLALAEDFVSSLWSLLGSVMILSGMYFLLYVYSRARFGEEKTWIGFGDVKLGLGLALLLGNWVLAFVALFLANFIGTILVLPSMITKKLRGDSRISFGPLMIIGFLIVWFSADLMLHWYQFII